MVSRLRPWLALAVSALVHVGLALFLVGHASRVAREGGNAAQPGPAMMVRLVGAVRPAAQDRVTLAAADLTAAVPASRPAPAAELRPQAEAGGNDGVEVQERHYFGASAMTQQPEVAEGLVGGKLLVVPGITPQAVDLQVWISDEGAVERVALDSPMSEKEKQMLLAAFASVRFQPGRIGRIAVRGHVALQVMLDYALRM
ncbi:MULTISPECIES: hypothetical protein [unclassified Duganella]|uniref:hypothetical protein n=1 Tax=unclassified Duganella TaxID=2636909 RepID=UPI0006F861B5|nr:MULTISPECIES: hypothetical protein [unclassified Duganella]KQV61627.1 hypothetical protein ASD07_01935 [Duganella sp. Root336D2]KRB84136.1 hypothetical protein ASE26_08600 [Duganella sp. Root198D2]